MLAHPLRFIRITAALIGCALGMAVHAQVNIDAGSLLRQTERDLAAPMPTPGLQAPASGPSRVAKPSDATVQVRGFTLVGNTLLSTEELRKALPSSTTPIWFSSATGVFS
jgi:hypothetical protein